MKPLPVFAIAACLASCSSKDSSVPAVPPPPDVGADGGVAAADGGPSQPFQADPPSVYVAKVKNILVGLPPTDDEVKAVVADPRALGDLIDQWMALPAYSEKMQTFFALAFQQTQLTAVDFLNLGGGLGNGSLVLQLVENVSESFARTAVAEAANGTPLNQLVGTKRIMMTPALMMYYAYLDTHRVDDAQRPGADDLALLTNNATVYLQATPMIPVEQSVDPSSPNFMHWYDPAVAKIQWLTPGCATNTLTFTSPGSSVLFNFFLHEFTGLIRFKAPNGDTCRTSGGVDPENTVLGDADFNTWKMVTIRPPNPGESISRFFDLPGLRAANELVLKTPRPGFFSTPAFFANWSTNTSNQMRVTLNQTLIVATGKAIDGVDPTVPSSEPGIDPAHAAPGTACFSCHRIMDPTRVIFESTYTNAYSMQEDPKQMALQGLFAFQGVMNPSIGTIDDFAGTLAGHPLFAEAWAQKLCYYANSAPCASSDPEFQRVVADFKASNFKWSTLVRELLSSPIVTNATQTATAAAEGEIVAVTRRDHLCAALDQRLGLDDVCGLRTITPRGVNPTSVEQIVLGLPSDGYGRGATVPVLPTSPTLFYRAGTEHICESVADLVVDAPQNPKAWSSAKPDVAIADFVATMIGMTPSDPRAAQATAILQQHFDDAKAGQKPTDALKSTFVAACLSPSFVGIGL
jgi:hypothetical protein